MRLTQEQVEELIGRLSQYGEINCPVCRNHRWNVNSLIIESREFIGGDITLGGSIMPFIPLTCQTCGNTLFLNAMSLGFVNNNGNGQHTDSTTGAATTAESTSGNGNQ